MTKEDREVLSIVNPRGKEFRERYESEKETETHTTNPNPEEEPEISKRNFDIASLILGIPIGWNAFILWDHVFRTIHQFNIGNDAAFPVGWERFDMVQILYRTLFLGIFIALYVCLKYVYKNQRRCDYGV